MMSLVPFVQLAVVGIASHFIENKIERSGYGGRVVYVKMATYVIYGCIALYQWRIALRMIGIAFGIHVP